MTFRRWIVWIILGATAVTVIRLSYISAGKQDHLPGGPTHAFMNADWGMSAGQIEKANQTTLVATTGGQHGAGAEDPSASFSYFEQSDRRFLGRQATVTYTLKNNQLVSYHVKVSDEDGERLDSDVRKHLIKKYGTNFSETENGGSSEPRLIWQSKEEIVNYWFFQREISLRDMYTAVIGINHELSFD